MEKKTGLSEEKYKNIFNVTDNAIIIYDKDYRSILEVNNAAVKMFGYSKSEFHKFKAGELGVGNGKYSKKIAKEWIEKSKIEGPQSFEWLAKTKTGREFWTRVNLKHSIIGENERLIALIYDIDKQKSAETSLKESEDRHRTLVENIPVGIVVHSLGEIVYINKSAIKIGKGKSKDQFIGRNIFDFIHSSSKKIVSERVKKISKNHIPLTSVEEKYVCIDGTVIDVEVTSTAIEFGEKPAIQVIIRDITEKKIFEKKLRESEKSYKDLFNNNIAAIYIQDKDGIFLDVNRGAEKMYGFPREYFVGKTPAELSAPNKNNLGEIKKCVLKAFDGEPQQFEFWGRRKNGEIFPKLVRLTRGNFFGKEVIFAFSIDITELKKAEEEQNLLKSRIWNSQKLESLGVLAGGIAHDFNNYLTGILGNAGLARMDIPTTAKSLNNIDIIEKTAIRAADLCNQLLAYSGKGRFVIKPVNINRIVINMTDLLQSSISKKISIGLNLENNIPSIEADISQIRQIIMNLVLNSSEAIGDNIGKISIITKLIKLDKTYIRGTFLGEKLIKGRYILLEISDTGCGIDQENLKNIFDPFFTTKDSGKGLGLAAVIGIIRGHGGTLKVYSEPGDGTSFKIFFPISLRKAKEPGEEDSKEIRLRGSGTILVADDEETIRTLGRDILEKFGFSVITAIDGEDTLIKFKEHSKKIKLVLLDMTMPKKDGVQVFKDLKKMSPSIKVILSSGYNEQDATNRFTSEELAGFIQKPYRPEDLLKMIFEILKKENIKR